MGSIRRISNNLFALVAGNGINMIQQLAYAPLFIHSYGEVRYGEWIALSEAVRYLGTLNFGVQTFVNQDLTLRYQRGERESYQVQQSTALRILLGIVLAAAALALIVFVLPLERFLRLSLSHQETSFTAYFLSLQILIGFIYGYLCGNYMIVGLSYRGTHWGNIQRLLLIALTCICVWRHSSLMTLATVQLASYLVCMVAILIDIKITTPEIFPSLRYWDREAVPVILKQSAYFGLITSSTFLAYSVPVLILQRTVGPVAVVMFTLMRTIFSMVRQLLNALTQSMGPEITRLYGQRDWPQLVRLYDRSERLIFFLIPVVNLSVFSASPLLLLLWVHKPNLFSLSLYAVMSAIAFVMCAKEHKHNFQFSTNTHQALAKAMFFSYIAMGVVSLATTPHWGAIGLLIAWLLTEIYQLGFIMRLNFHLFREHTKLDINYVVRLGIFAVVGIAGVASLLVFSRAWNIPSRIGLSLLTSLVVAAVSYQVFRMADVGKEFAPKILRRFGFGGA